MDIIFIIVLGISFLTCDKIAEIYGEKNHRNMSNIRTFSSAVHMIAILSVFYI